MLRKKGLDFFWGCSYLRLASSTRGVEGEERRFELRDPILPLDDPKNTNTDEDTMIRLFLKGGPIMWPLLITSIVALATVIERLLFRVREHFRRDPDVVENIFGQVEKGNINAAIRAGEGSTDYIARVVVYALTHREKSLSNAYLKAANQELQRFNRGLPILDTIITLAPLLGLLGTVTGLIRAFGLLGAQELGSPMAITGGIAEALVATAFGLAIAITALIPFNYLNARLEEARNVIQDAGSQLELLLGQGGGSAGASSGSGVQVGRPTSSGASAR
jgi:biopolymer transport protein ExbB